MRILRDPGQPGAGGGGSGTATATTEATTSTTPDWRTQLPEDIRSLPVFQSVPDIATLGKNYVNAQSLIGQKRLAAPQPQWTPEQFGQFYDEIGRPKKAEEYTVPKLELPAGTQLDEGMVAEARKQFHAAGLTSKQFETVLGLYGNVLKGSVERATTEASGKRLEAENALKAEWGDKFGQNVDLAKAALSKFGEPGLIEYLDQTGLGNDPRLIKLLSKVSQGMMEDRTHVRTQDLNITDSTKAAQEIESLKMDSKFLTSMWSKSDPGHQAAIQRWEDLHRKAFPGKNAEE